MNSNNRLLEQVSYSRDHVSNNNTLLMGIAYGQKHEKINRYVGNLK